MPDTSPSFDADEPPAEVQDPLKPRDPVFLAAFVADFFVLVYLAGVGGVSGVGDAWAQVTDTPLSASLFRALPLALGAMAVLMALWMAALYRHGASIIKYTLLGAVAFNAVAGVLLLVAFNASGGLGLLLAAALTYWYYTWVRRRIPFAAAALTVACDALRDAPSVFGVAAVGSCVQLLWVALCVAATGGLFALTNDRAGSSTSPPPPAAPVNTGTASNGMTPTYAATWEPSAAVPDGTPLLNTGYFFLAFSLYWGTSVLRHIVSCTVAGNVGWWWFWPSRPSRTSRALQRSVTTSLGSLAFGGAVVSFIEALTWAVRRAQAQRHADTATRALGGTLPGRAAGVLSVGGGFFGRFAGCLLQLLRRMAEYVTHYAVVRIAIWGEDFVTAGRATLELFRHRGWSAIINDRLVQRVLALGVLCSSVLSGVVAAGAVASPASSENVAGMSADAIVSSAAAAAIAMSAAVVFSSVVSGAVAAVFVLFAADPEKLSEHHPDAFRSLLSAWEQAHPDTLKSSGLDRAPCAMAMLRPARV